jgi:hypothetical protein
VATQLIVEIPVSMREVIDPALVRLGVIFPEIKFDAVGSTIQANTPDGFDHTELKKQILNTVYREVVFQRTVGIRAGLFQ